MTLSLAAPLPKGSEYLADVVEKVCAGTDVSPYLMLGFLYAESNFGQALKPKTPEGSGDFIARASTPERDARMKQFPLPGAVRKELPDGIPQRKLAGPIMAWVPTTNGWGCGLFQIDYEAHFEFCKGGNWKDPAKCCAYAIGILKSARTSLKKLSPTVTGVDLDRAVIAAYNAGAGRVSKFLKEGKGLDAATFHPGYVDKICRKADELAGHSGSWVSGVT